MWEIAQSVGFRPFGDILNSSAGVATKIEGGKRRHHSSDFEIRASRAEGDAFVLAGVDKDAVAFCYEIACEGTCLAGSRLVIETVPLLIYCEEYKMEHTPESIYEIACPQYTGRPRRYFAVAKAVIAKMDLAAAAEFDMVTARRNIQSVRPGMYVLAVSSKNGQGMDEAVGFLQEQINGSRAAALQNSL